MRRRPGRDRIIAAYASLLENKPAEDITIKELVRHAQVNRSTFYNHFSSIKEVEESIFGGFFDALREANESFHHGDWVETGTESSNPDLVFVLRFMYEHRNETTVLLNGSLRQEFIDSWVDAYLEEYERYSYEFFNEDGTPANLSPQELGYMLYQSAYQTIGFVEYWALTSFQESPEELATFIIRVQGLTNKRSRRSYQIKRAEEQRA